MKWKNNRRHGELVSSTLKAGKFKIVIHRYIGYPPDVWLMTCYGLFENRQAASKVLEEAQRQAKAVVQAELETAIREMVSDK